MKNFWLTTFIAWVIIAALIGINPAFALDANAQSSDSSALRSMDDIARMIRQKNGWQILDARSRSSGSVVWYRFKLISKKGKVKIIKIDPSKPNLRILEQ